MRLFKDRRAAAVELSRHLSFLQNDSPIVLGLVYGGVPMAEIIAQTLGATPDVLLIERLRAPKNPDHIVGAVDEHGRISMIKSTARWHHLTSQQMVEPAREVFRELQRLRGRIRSVLPEFDVRGRTVILVSQGVASGAKMLGAVASVRDRGARKVVVAAPAGSGKAAWQLHDAADVVVIPHRPAKFQSVEDFYEDNTPVTDEMLLAIAESWAKRRPQSQPDVHTILMKLHNELGELLCCEIDLPPGTTRGSGPYPTAVFAHGYESDGRSPRTIPISRRLAKRGIIAVRPEFSGHGRSEGELANATKERMATDLRHVLHAVGMLDEVDTDRVALVGSGSGAMLCLEHAAREGDFRAIVVRGPMSGGEIEAALPLRAPTLIIHAELDHGLQPGLAPPLPSCHQLVQIPSATRLFGDVISFEMMVGATVDWLFDHLVPAPVAESTESGEPGVDGDDGAMPPAPASPTDGVGGPVP